MITKQLLADAIVQLTKLETLLMQIDADADTDSTHFAACVESIYADLAECVQVK